MVIRGLTTLRWVEERKKVWGEENPIYQARVLGEFPDAEEDTLIPLSWIERAVERAVERERNLQLSPEEEPQPVILSVDVARFGSDKSVVLRRRGDRVEDMRVYRGLDSMKLTGHVAEAIRAWSPQEVAVDEVGIGAGVVDRLRELGHRVNAVNVGRAARDGADFANLRAEGYWTLRQLFQDGHVDIPADSDLVGQLAPLRYSFNSAGQVIIESKDEMRRRGVPSPDKADALMMAFLSSSRRVKLWG